MGGSILFYIAWRPERTHSITIYWSRPLVTGSGWAVKRVYL